MKVLALIALIGVPFGILMSAQPEAKTKPLKEVGYELLKTDVTPGAFLHDFFQDIRAEKGRMEDTSAVFFLRSHNNVGGRCSYVAYHIAYVEMDGDIPVVDQYFWNNVIAANEDRFVSVGRMDVHIAGPKAGTYEGVWELMDGEGTGRFLGATGEGNMSGVFGEGYNEYEAEGWVTTVGSTK